MKYSGDLRPHLLLSNRRLANCCAFLLICLMTNSCGQAEMEDSSNLPEFANVVGKSFVTKQDQWAIGVTADGNYKKKVDYVVLVPAPGVSGPEVVSKETFPKSSVVRVSQVLKSKSRLTQPNVLYVVEVIGTEKFRGMQVRVSQTGSARNPNFGLDESLYQLTK